MRFAGLSASLDVRMSFSRRIGTWPFIETINNHILTGETYKALKEAKKLIAYEAELLNHAKRGTGVREDREAGRKSA